MSAMAAVSPEHAEFIRRVRWRRRSILGVQVALLVLFFGAWEGAVFYRLVDPLIASSPSRILTTLAKLHRDGSLYQHTLATLLEALAGFGLGVLAGIGMAIVLWWSDYLSRVLDPYIVVLNAVPKIALGPLFIVWLGAGITAIIGMTLAISVIIMLMMVWTAFREVNPEKILLLRSFGATRLQVFTKVVFPASMPTIIAALKTAIGLSWVGVIVGEFLTSTQGLGYLIVYGGQVFNLHLVMMSILVLSAAAAVMYQALAYLERRYLAWKG
ncbi:MAG: ABC transporter permease [Deltaproteobacteria bacterium]|nr:ABC transporter permease [Deltaproteobacteria bacterium]MBI3076584.1 ABC transporter permease [Deltaproteobacteria bacterium]